MFLSISPNCYPLQSHNTSETHNKAIMSKIGEGKSENQSIQLPFIPPNPNLRSSTGEVKTLEDSFAPVPFNKDMIPIHERYNNEMLQQGNFPPLSLLNEERNNQEDDRGSEDRRHQQYPFPRDEPSPDIRRHQYVDNIQNYNVANAEIQDNHVKRKEGEEEGPQLISHQSSDDSMHGLLSTSNSNFEKKNKTKDDTNKNNDNNENDNKDDQGPLMKTYSPLSAIESRTFSHDEQLDSLARSMINPKSSVDGLNLFQSWSFGVPDGSTSFDDPVLRKGTSRVWDEKPMIMAPKDDGYYYTDNWSHLPPRPPPPGSAAACQPLHPEERVVPFTDHLYRHVENSNRALQGNVEDCEEGVVALDPRYPYHHQKQQRQNYTNMPHLRQYPPVPRRMDYEPSHAGGSFESSSNQELSAAKSQDDSDNNDMAVPPYHRSHWNGGAQQQQFYPAHRHHLHQTKNNYHPAVYHHLTRHPPPHLPHLRFNERFGEDRIPPQHHLAPHYSNVDFSRFFAPVKQQQQQQQRGTDSSSSSLAKDFSSSQTGKRSNTAVASPEDGTPTKNYSGNHMDNVKVELGPDGSAVAMRTADNLLLLSLPDDKVSLSETLCIVRENIEVFIANEADVKAPAPGRKRPVVVGQVGLRCIHCRSATLQYDKVKRAVCFPSSLRRIYRTVIDMKLDHFKACKFVPDSLKTRLEELKVGNARSTGTTMQYFVQAAEKLGMVDGVHGIRMVGNHALNPAATSMSTAMSTITSSFPPLSQNSQEIHRQNIHRKRKFSETTEVPSFSLSKDASLGGESTFTSLEGSSAEISIHDNIQYFEGKRVLSLPSDKSTLSPLRCFLRENTVAFSATAEDIAVRTPTTFAVQLGQVGIGCKHCYFLPPKQRSNRAVCFPFSIGRIYQSVADIQRFHMAECSMVPADVKAKFHELLDASSKGSKGLATRQYWITTAKKIGLTDTSNGIRFYRDPSIPAISKNDSLDLLAQVASVSPGLRKPLVFDEDRPHIAEFIFESMKQLQPCRFTDADRNKRRLKDVGCVGVECKHCAGNVDGRKFFWSSVSAVESNFVSVHTHLMECRMVPDEFKKKLARLKTLRKEQTAKLKNGSQKAFFTRVWKRLHTDNNSIPVLPKEDDSLVPPHVSVLHRDVSFQSESYNSPNNSFPVFASPLSSNHSNSNSSLGAVPSPPTEYTGHLHMESPFFVPGQNNQDPTEVAL